MKVRYVEEEAGILAGVAENKNSAAIQIRRVANRRRVIFMGRYYSVAEEIKTTTRYVEECLGSPCSHVIVGFAGKTGTMRKFLGFHVTGRTLRIPGCGTQRRNAS